MEAPPIISEKPRIPAAWPSLFIIFALLITVAVRNYWSFATRPKDLYLAAEGRLRSKVLTQSIQDHITGAPKPTPPDEDTFPQKLLDTRATDPKVTKLDVAWRFQEGRPISPADLAGLFKSKNPADVAFAKIYSAKTLTPSQARQLGDALPKEPFANSVARVHALMKAGVQDPTSIVISPLRRQLFFVAVALIGFALVAGFVLWVVYLALRSSGKLVPLGHPAGWLARPDADRFAVRTSQLLVMLVVAETIIAGLLLSTHLTSSAVEAIASLGVVLLIPVMALLPVGGRRIPAWQQGWNKDHFGKNVAWGLAAACANAPLLIVLAGVGSVLFGWLPSGQHPVALQIQAQGDLVTVLLLSGVASICAPILEETIFRGTLLPALSSRFNSIAAGIVVSSLLFAAMHPQGPTGWLPLAGIGAVSAMLTYQTRSLVPSLVMHGVHNLVTLLLLLAIG